jgi:V/A-type H+-transporting ATPase subunit K
MIFLFPLVLIAVIALPLIFAYHQKVNGRAASSIKKTLITNISVFALVVLAAVILPIGGFVSAASVSAVNATNISVGAGLGYLAAALATGISGIGAGIAVASGSAAAIGAITEDPKVFGRAILFVGLGEGVAIYGFVISVLIWIKI